jgi:polyisoprenoid-binding protein YceI
MYRLIALLILTAVSLPASAAQWQLAGAPSSLYFLSIKKGSVAETHHFDRLSGSYADGTGHLTIDLTSVETGIDIRDKRMREQLFEVGRFAEATVTLEVDDQRIAALEPGRHVTLDTTATLSLHGQDQELDTLLDVTRLADDTLLVRNLKPVVIDAGAFNLAAGVEKLREIAGLSAISPAVPAQFTLYFVQR